MLAQTNATGIVRDLNNNALLANDKTARQAQREEFRRRQEVVDKMNDINIMKEHIQELLRFRDEFQEFKLLLQNHIQRDSQTQSQE